MKEPFTGFTLTCDKCGEPFYGDDCFLVMQEDEIADYCTVYDWKIDGDKHYCDNCQNPETDE